MAFTALAITPAADTLTLFAFSVTEYVEIDQYPVLSGRLVGGQGEVKNGRGVRFPTPLRFLNHERAFFFPKISKTTADAIKAFFDTDVDRVSESFYWYDVQTDTTVTLNFSQSTLSISEAANELFDVTLHTSEAVI